MGKCFYPGCPNIACKKSCQEHAELYAKWTNNNYNRQRRCGLPELSLEEYIEHSKQWYGRMRRVKPSEYKTRHRVNQRDTHDGAESTDAICPKCGIKHKVWINWTGRGTPRKYCQNCRGVVEPYERPTCDQTRYYEPRRAGMAL